MMKTLFRTFIALLLLSSCQKDVAIFEVDPCLSTSPKPIELKFNYVFGDQAFQLQTDYTLSDGHHVKFETAQFYLSEISLIKNNQNIKSTNDVGLFSPSKPSLAIGALEQASYSGFAFTFGIDSTRNHSDPTVYPSGHPLSFQIPSMHWDWNQGYIFAVMEGRYSSEAITSSNPGSPFSYHIGLDKNSKSGISRNFTLPYTVKACENSPIRLRIDIANIFTGLNVSVDNSTQSTFNFPLSAAVRENIINAISSEQ
jgi:hypothetical protein